MGSCLLPILLAIYDVITSRKHRTGSDQKDEEDEDDIGNDIFEDLVAWFQPSRSAQLVGTLSLSCGAFVLLRPNTQSTVICQITENRTAIVIFQCLGVCLDAIILVLAWRLLAWSQTTKTRLRRLSIVLISSSVLIALVILIPNLIRYRLKGRFQFSETYGVDPLYFFDVFTDGLIFAAFFISLSLFTCQSSPLISTGIITLICGVLAAYHKLGLLGTYEELDSWVILPIWTMCLGFLVFMYRNQTRVIISAGLMAFVFGATVMVVSIYALAARGVVLDLHPVHSVMSRIRTSEQRWHTQATTSASLKVAVDEYRERHRGRNPPRGFAEWYDYAIQRDTPIIDYFQQIENDILPFLGMKPSQVRDDISRIGTSGDISLLSVKKGIVSHETADPAHNAIMDDLVELIRPFAQHLSDMDLPINLLDRPRVLAPWSDKTRYEKVAMAKGFDLLTSGLSKRDEPSSTEDGPEDGLNKVTQTPPRKVEKGQWVTTWKHQRQLGQACPPKSPARWGFYANNRDFCSSCANPQAEGQFLKNWTQAQDVCHQPDMFNLHGFYMANMPLQTFDELVPIFGRSKTDRFSDILIPLSRDRDAYTTDSDDKLFVSKDSRIFWRGEVGADAEAASPRLLSGGHQERLSHVVNNASATDYVTMCLAIPGDKDRFRYEMVPLREANAALKLDAGMSDYSMCAGGPGCDAAKAEFGFKPEDKDDAVRKNSRYVVVMDSDDGPPRDLLRTLRSNSIPLVASVFKEWYSERLFPWLHFVPIDLRFHGLHSTLAFLAGLQGKGLINGRNVAMQGSIEDAKMIAQEGRAWAEKAIRREDAEIYMFRLLIEWGRIVSDKRDEMDFVLPTS
ncbi:hypothetical protein SLS53_005511 [Cytospora paraplurivora]|uniref:Glycosyl transferase CAP10 domain-containing protein n=1 Tax=Cytospora paraplurivora TaxID=2898453 RepID=A0AAN9YG80_9PEZI